MTAPAVLADTGLWREQARCAGTDVALFFADAVDDLRAAQQVFCVRCGVRPDCLRSGMAFEVGQTRYGLVGGLSARQRQDQAAVDAVLAGNPPPPVGAGAGRPPRRA